MKILSYYILTIGFLITAISHVYSQHLTKEEAIDYFKTMPSFSTDKDNYAILGIPLNQHVSQYNSDVKNQISFRQMITRESLFWDTYFFVSYSQTAYWHVFEKSSPFTDITFNPAIGFVKPIFNKEEHLQGLFGFEIQHNSNGRDGKESRTWNRIQFNYTQALSHHTLIGISAWIPFLYKADNPQILDYEGLFKLKLNHDFIPSKLSLHASLQKGLKSMNGKFNLRLYYSPFKKNNRQYIALDWFAGHGETLLEYKKFTNMIRIGYVIKSDAFEFLKGNKN